jgi:hypothetical protein
MAAVPAAEFAHRFTYSCEIAARQAMEAGR